VGGKDSGPEDKASGYTSGFVLPPGADSKIYDV